MQKLVFRNGEGTEINLTSGNYGIVNWSGLSECSQEIQSQQVPFNDGSVYLDNLLSEREMTFTIAINDDKDLQKRYELKRELISILNPKLKEGYLIYTNDYLSRQIKCIPDLPIFENKNFNDTGTLKAELVFTANNPYWEDIEETIVDVKRSDGLVEISNNGDVPVNVEIDVTNLTSLGFKIENRTNNNIIEFSNNEYDYVQGNFNINTESGKKEVKNTKFIPALTNLDTAHNVIYSEQKGIYTGSEIYSNDGEIWNTHDRPLEKVVYVDWLDTFFGFSQAYESFVIFKSTNGKYWNSVYTTYQYTMLDIVCINRYIAVLYKDTNNNYGIIYSPNGYEWSVLQITSGSTPYPINKICYANNKFYVMCTGGYNYSSTNLITWTRNTSLPFHDSEEKISVFKYFSELGIFLVCGNTRIWIGRNGTDDWRNVYNVIDNDIKCLDAEYASKLEKLLIVCEDGKILTSRDGSVYELSQIEELRNVDIDSICYNNNKCELVISCGTLYKSYNGVTWEKLINNGILENSINGYKDIVYSQQFKKYYAINNYRVYYSEDGKNWILCSTVADEELKTLAVSENGSVMVAGDNITGITTNGIDWTFSSSTYQFIKAIYSTRENKFYAIAKQQSTYYIIHSTDTINWTRLGSYTEQLTCIAYKEKNSRVIVGGNNVLIWFDDLHLPSKKTLSYRPIIDICYSEFYDMFIYTTGNGIGISKTGDINNFIDYPVSGINRIMASGKYIIGASFYGVMISTDGINYLMTSIDGSYDFNAIINNNITLVGKNISQLLSVKQDSSLLNKLSTSLNFRLEVGKNNIIIDYIDGSPVATFKFKNKYVGV